MTDAKEITVKDRRHVPADIGQTGGGTLMETLASAVQRGLPAETLNVLMDFQERYEAASAKAAYDADMAAMQGDLPVIEKTRPGHSWKYADWGDIKQKINPILKQHGFAITHRIEARENDIIVTAICSHKAGHREETSLPLPYDTSGSKNAVQARGSTVQYGTRYTGCAIAGIAIKGEDKDGARLNERGEDPQEEAAPLLDMIDKAARDELDDLPKKIKAEAEKRKLSQDALGLVRAHYSARMKREKELANAE